MARIALKKQDDLKHRRNAPLITPTDLGTAGSRDIAGAKNAILADVFSLCVKTKNLHWHMSGAHFRTHHLLLDEQADQLYAMTDPIAERIRKTGGSTRRSIGHIARTRRIEDTDADYFDPLDIARRTSRGQPKSVEKSARSARHGRGTSRYCLGEFNRNLDR
jgi:starvation-inducible DNA-binding protein